jgi:hypothetical protein
MNINFLAFTNKRGMGEIIIKPSPKITETKTSLVL